MMPVDNAVFHSYSSRFGISGGWKMYSPLARSGLWSYSVPPAGLTAGHQNLRGVTRGWVAESKDVYTHVVGMGGVRFNFNSSETAALIKTPWCHVNSVSCVSKWPWERFN